ncbi:metal-sulfur cluster assembly factor [Deinococcus metallilatus]|uniref:Metal-sulfur cluster assembly factor n=3 Tax=Deinococcus TaxID=1298 RepID=A0AAJ5F3T4_9DEIO|nr:metal-sulfur cluster assembly factor [Deinococcus metallilatus]RXJ10283.1 metal-sulfur cluster assembly factor [Deinococcus metallilatus]TLK28131.1 metal-sulfur cluster assembly factor [Deinococcus metallilatus]
MPQRRPQRPRRAVPAGQRLCEGREPGGRHAGLEGRGPAHRGRERLMEDSNTNAAPQDAATLPTEAQVLEALKVVKDPEIPVNVVDLGLIYGVDIMPGGLVDITMTLTSVGCPVQDLIRADAEMAVGRLDGVNEVNVEFVWTPPWGPDKMTEDGKRQMRMFGFNV